MSKHTPWGAAQSRDTLADGIVSYSTASHGGIWLSKERREMLKKLYPNYKNFLDSWEWWEEDCDWALPFYVFSEDIRKHFKAKSHDKILEGAERILREAGVLQNNT